MIEYRNEKEKLIKYVMHHKKYCINLHKGIRKGRLL